MQVERFAICKCGWSFYIKDDSAILWKALAINNAELVNHYPAKTDEDLICLLAALHERRKGEHHTEVHEKRIIEESDMKRKHKPTAGLENKG